MSVTYGFYNSLNHDRLYDAIQFGSIFDGIVRDGIFHGIGDRFAVKAYANMIITVGEGRAWFNRTWILNDALLPLEVPQSEVLLNRYDAVIIETNAEQAVRENSIKIIKGTPSSNPTYPTLTRSATVNQYPLAYIYVKAGATQITQANITSMIGTTNTPYCTGILEMFDIDAQINQFTTQWQEFFEVQQTEMNEVNAFWREQWQTWFYEQTQEVQQAILDWGDQWDTFYNSRTTDMDNTAAYWKTLWAQWFNEYTNQDQAQWESFFDQTENWVATLHDLLDQEVASKLAAAIQKVSDRVDILEECCKGISGSEHAIYDVLYDNDLRSFEAVQDNNNADILDSDADKVYGRGYSTEAILDSNGDPIYAKVVLVVK